MANHIAFHFHKGISLHRILEVTGSILGGNTAHDKKGFTSFLQSHWNITSKQAAPIPINSVSKIKYYQFVINHK